MINKKIKLIQCINKKSHGSTQDLRFSSAYSLIVNCF